ncbi:hypothetical protein [Rhodanobacter ginsenosidimutans]|uniref:Uncharacterized protein n=1 Tax=Rhodanobacter ginsenosidimutans TaxID=490571 RepID=A0ABW0JT76_9GAMM
MATPKPFPHAGFLHDLEQASAAIPVITATSLSPSLARILLTAEGGPSAPVVADLIELLKARKAVLQASVDGELVADALRRYQKFAKPGQPSAHIVQLRQQQGAARQAGSQARQAFIKAAAAFVRAAGIEVPARVALERFVIEWLDANVPKGPLPRDEVAAPSG